VFYVAGATAQEGGYTLNAGDTISVHVYGESDLSFDRLLIGQNGRISYPFLGELKVAGNTAAELQQELIEGLKPDYLVDPRVSVSIVKYRPFFVNGEQVLVIADKDPERKEQKVGLDYRVQPGDIFTVKDTFF
jgi:polysaccharide export outer membrane protein